MYFFYLLFILVLQSFNLAKISLLCILFILVKSSIFHEIIFKELFIELFLKNYF